MNTHNLEKIFAPRNVAVIGASIRADSVGNTVVRNLINGGFAGTIYPINPKHSDILGLNTFKNVREVPEAVDLAVVCTPAITVPQIVDECGNAGVGGVVVLSAGFQEIGTHGRALQNQLAAVIGRHPGMRVIGPNCLGILAPHVSLNASFAADMPKKGRIAFLSQSGALCTAVLDWALQEQIGFSSFVSIGNSIDVGMADLIDYFAADASTDAIILYIESLTNARAFMSAARSFTRNKPIIAYKAGRFAQSASAAASHTGAMAGVDAVYDAAFKRAGIVRVHQMGDMFDCAELLASSKLPQGSRVAIVTNAGGPGVMATDQLLELGGELAEISPSTIEKLNQFLPFNWSHANPIDVIGDAPPQRFAQALQLVLDDDQVDAVVALFAPQAMSNPTETANSVIAIARTSAKPILTSWMGGKSMQQAISLFNGAGVPTYWAPEQAINAFSFLDRYRNNRELLYDTPKHIHIQLPNQRPNLHSVLKTVVSKASKVVSEVDSKSFLDAYGIPVCQTYEATSAEEAVKIARQIGYPVVMKILSQDITHKTDVGGVALDVANDDDVLRTFAQMQQNVHRLLPHANLQGVTVQKMIGHAAGRELIVGAKRDPVFGMVLLVGAGGTSAEILNDCALELPPLTERLARKMLESLRLWPLLQGYRGALPVNVDRLIEVLLRVSDLVADNPEIQELDINPLIVTPDNAIALDARVVLDPHAVANPPAAYSHLVIRPYPHELICAQQLKNGTSITVRR
jgi:acetyltransferase